LNHLTAISYLPVLTWFCLILTLAMLLYGVILSRYLFVKPSMIFALFFHVQIQWPSALYWTKIASNLTNPLAYFILAQIFPLLLVAGSILIGRHIARQVYDRVVNLPRSSYGEAFLPILPLALISLTILAWYLTTVPWEKMGLHAVIYDPENAKLAREHSLKLLTNKYLKYAVSIFNSSLAPVLACLIGIKMLDNWQQKKYPYLGLYLVCLAPILLAVSLSGARGPSAMILLAVFFLMLLIKGLPLQPVRIVLVLALILAVPGMVELLRAGGAFNPAEMRLRYAVIIERAIGYGMTQDAQWHIEYVTKYGYWGIAGVERLAPLFGIKPIDIMNVVGKIYTNTQPLASVSANASMIFIYYACFGWIALPLCLLLAWLLDATLYIYNQMQTIMLPVAIAACGISVVNLAHTAYTTIFITHGFLIILTMCFVCDKSIVKLRSKEIS